MFSQLVLALPLFIAYVSAQYGSAQYGSGVTTRYWDCCKTSCAWPGKASVTAPVGSCSAQNQLMSDSGNTASSCNGGSAFACADNSPFAVNDTVAYGFAAVNIAGESESDWCCQCYELTFTSGPVAGKRMVVQATNTGGDLGTNQFDLMIPGGGVGIFDGCAAQYGSWDGGAQYGGISSRADCGNLPSALQAGCYFRFDWFKGADNPTVTWTQTTCPSELISITGCARK